MDTNKNKKIDWKLSIAPLIFILVVMGISTIYYNANHYNSDDKTLRDLVKKVKENNDNNNGYEVSFNESYNIKYSSNVKEDESDNSIAYDNEGYIKLSYKNDNVISTKTTDFISKDKAYFTGVQKEKYISNASNYERNNNFILEVDTNNLYVISNNKYIDNINKDNKEESFSGKIDKSILNEIDGEKSNNLESMDSWDYIDIINELSNYYLTDVDFTSARVIKDFIKENEIKISNLDGIVKLEFNLYSGNILSKLSVKELDNPPVIKGEMEIEEKTGNLISYKYDLSKLLEMVLEEEYKDKSYLKITIDKFDVEGKKVNEYDYISNKDYVEYNENNISDFKSNISNYMIETFRMN